MCKSTSTGSCLPEQFEEYGELAKPLLKKIRSEDTTRAEKNKASEELGTDAAKAIDANSHGETMEEEDPEIEEFSGSGVFDGVRIEDDGTIIVYEAKGGKSHFGSRKLSGSTKRVKQCTPVYVHEIAEVMATSNYKGHHPMVGCANHEDTPDDQCHSCQREERHRRRRIGQDVLEAFKKGKVKKIAVRGDYDKDCLKVPSVVTSYSIDAKGGQHQIKV